MPEHMSSLQQLGAAALVLAAVLWTVILIRLLRREPRPGPSAPRPGTPQAGPFQTRPDVTGDAVDMPAAPAQPNVISPFAHRARRPRTRHHRAVRTGRATLRALPRQHTPITDSVTLTPTERATFDALVRQWGHDDPPHQP
ncbi:hypothetical protein ACFV0R_08095 [Streptomyces sp. NPDC059578]|uniref:hypothetical protein n=1 Tax=Streptomyces sp. NPDC059578 TaxID=3346874 RepID=UPI0036B0DAF8